jgi:zinc transport system permease protein
VAEVHPHEHGIECGHEAIPHGDHVDYVHDGHLHAAHESHYDEHGHEVPHGGGPEGTSHDTTESQAGAGAASATTSATSATSATTGTKR